MEAMIERIAFWVFSILAVLAAIGVVMNRNPVAGAMCLVMTFLAVAGLYLTLGATFLTAVQILVYAGAIMVLFLFVIMLLNLERDVFEAPGVGRAVAGAFAAAFVFVAVAVVKGTPDPVSTTITDGGSDAIGKVFMTDYLFAFEMASVLLLVAIIGAILVARRRAGPASSDAGARGVTSGSQGGLL